MDPDHEIYDYESYHASLHESFLDQQPSYLPQPNSGGETFVTPGNDWILVDPATPSAGLPSGNLPGVFGNHTRGHAPQDGHGLYQVLGGGNSAANQVNDSSDALETLSQTSFHFPPISYPNTSTAGSFDLIASHPIRPSCTPFTSNGIQHYRCVCGHETRRRGDMRRHHESSKHSHRKHVCSLCEKSFTRQDGLTRHRKKMHPCWWSDSQYPHSPKFPQIV